MLHGRGPECALIDSLIADVVRGHSGVVVFRGEAGVGKSALLGYAAEQAGGMPVLRAAGAESESELAFSGLHQLLRPALHLVDRLPAPRSAALRVVLGLSAAPLPDRFLVSLAVLDLLAEYAGEEGLLCVVDDAQWLDPPSADALVFAARRLQAEGLGMLFAARVGEPRQFDAPGLPLRWVSGLSRDPALVLLAESSPVPVDPQTGRRLVDRAHGNPLALVELPRLLGGDVLSGSLPLPDVLPLGDRLARAFLEQVLRLPAETRTLLLLAAADHGGDPATVFAAGRALGVDAAALEPAETAGLVHVDADGVTFRHPLVRSAIYRGASFLRRRRIHLALADALQGEANVDRRTWHRASAAAGPDNDVAEALVRAAERASARAGHAAAAIALERAADLTTDPARRVRRLADAAQEAWLAGRRELCAGLLDRIGEPQAAAVRADVLHLRGRLELGAGTVSDAFGLLCEAADLAGPSDPAKALGMLTQACRAAGFAGDAVRMAEAVRRADALPRTEGADSAFARAFLGGSAAVLQGDMATGIPLLRRALELTPEQPDQPEDLAWAGIAATWLGRPGAARDLFDRGVALARAAGHVGSLPFVLGMRTFYQRRVGDLAEAGATASEAVRLAHDVGQPGDGCYPLASLAWIAAVRGDDAACREYAREVMASAAPRGLGLPYATAAWALALLDLGAGRSEAAARRLFELTENTAWGANLALPQFSTPDLIEAAVRAGDRERIGPALATFAEWTHLAGTPTMHALLARCEALVAPDADRALECYAEALRQHHLAAKPSPLDRARTELLYGEALRRARRPGPARAQLRSAIDTLDRIGATPWADRARSELRATGGRTHVAAENALHRLTPQELQIARLVGSGATNREVAAQLFLSPRTVEYHLRKIFPKLDITSRVELVRLALPES